MDAVTRATTETFLPWSYLTIALQACKEACALRQVQGLLKIRGELTKSSSDETVSLLWVVMAATVAVAGVAVVVVVGSNRSNVRRGSVGVVVVVVVVVAIVVES